MEGWGGRELKEYAKKFLKVSMFLIDTGNNH